MHYYEVVTCASLSNNSQHFVQTSKCSITPGHLALAWMPGHLWKIRHGRGHRAPDSAKSPGGRWCMAAPNASSGGGSILDWPSCHPGSIKAGCVYSPGGLARCAPEASKPSQSAKPPSSPFSPHRPLGRPADQTDHVWRKHPTRPVAPEGSQKRFECMMDIPAVWKTEVSFSLRSSGVLIDQCWKSMCCKN